MDPDVDLIHRALLRDDRAFGELFDRHSVAVYRLAYAQTHDVVSAQELVQETFISAWKKLSEIRLIDASLLPWLLVTCRYHAQNLRRVFAKRDVLPLDDYIARRGLAAPPDAPDAHAEELAWAFEAVAGLSETDRRVVELCLFEDRSYREAASQLGITMSSVTKQVQRSRERRRRERAERRTERVS